MSVDNIELGPCNVTFGGTDLGLTKGGVEVEFSTEVAQITADQFGDTILDDVIRGRNVMVRVPMTERDLEKLAAVFPETTLVGSTTKRLVFNDGVGTSLRALADELILKPKGAGDDTKNVTIPLAMAKGDMSFAFKHDEQRVYQVEFTGYVNIVSGQLWNMGDPAAT